jgi:hypothetical protein
VEGVPVWEHGRHTAEMPDWLTGSGRKSGTPAVAAVWPDRSIQANTMAVRFTRLPVEVEPLDPVISWTGGNCSGSINSR